MGQQLHPGAKKPCAERNGATPLDALGVLLEEVEVEAEVEDAEVLLSSSGPNSSGHSRVPRPIICQNLIFE